MDPEIADFARSFRAFTKAMTRAAKADLSELTPVGQHIQDFLGADLNEIEPVTETFPSHQVIDIDVALEALVSELDGARYGISGPDRAEVDTLTDYLTHTRAAFGIGPVAYERQATGPESDRLVVAFGLGEVRVDNTPLVWLQRTAQPQYGRMEYTLEVICSAATVAEAFLARVRVLMAEHSVLRGQVISFVIDDFDYHDPGSKLTFLRRPEVRADQVILPAGVLDRVERHVVGIGKSRDALRAAGQHLKRGVLLYGPPGTGKTHLVRHLLSETEGTTAVLLSGQTLGLLNEATTLARAVQPAIVVLEDCDLVAQHRGAAGAALFNALEAMDGLAPDADITFILTTNRADLLERALVERPGRVDLAVEIAKPDFEGRERLFRLYAAELLASGQLTEAAVHTAAARTEGVTASFTKELIRRCVINATLEGRAPNDADVSHALDEMLSDAEALTRTLLGGEGRSLAGPLGPDDDDDDDFVDDEDGDDEPDWEEHVRRRGPAGWVIRRGG
ncbi:MAG TPA: ATP-binding protein [Propionibacteriaceae bacterium]|nr:ATP-binding protein [Propionibacteriaceae bacterium]